MEQPVWEVEKAFHEDRDTGRGWARDAEGQEARSSIWDAAGTGGYMCCGGGRVKACGDGASVHVA